jgi:hypothetical protein
MCRLAAHPRGLDLLLLGNSTPPPTVIYPPTGRKLLGMPGTHYYLLVSVEVDGVVGASPEGAIK